MMNQHITKIIKQPTYEVLLYYSGGNQMTYKSRLFKLVNRQKQYQVEENEIVVINIALDWGFVELRYLVQIEVNTEAHTKEYSQLKQAHR